MFKEIFDQDQLEPRNCVFIDDIEDNSTLDVKSYDAVDVLKKLNKQKLSIFLWQRVFC